MTLTVPTLAEAMDAPELFGAWFGAPSFAAWRMVAKALDGTPLSDAEAAAFATLAGGREPPSAAVAELWLVKGRRAGGSLFAGAFAVHAACFGRFGPRLGPGEVATVALLAADRKQARVLMRYVTGLLEVPLLAPLVVARTTESVTLETRCVIEVHTSSYRTTRGYALAAAVCDEIAFWHSDEASANPDKEVLAALRPALASLDGRLLCLSSPYARRGALWDVCTRKRGKADARVLVLQGGTRAFNPTIPQAVIDAALSEDEAAARAEWLAEFRTDVEAFVAREVVAACVMAGRRELPAQDGVAYVGFVDPSGGSADSMTLAVAHAAGERVVLDVVREVRPPFSPEAVVAEFCQVLAGYRVTTVTGDRYAGEWPREQFRKRGVEYRVSAQAKSEIYVRALALLNSGRAELLDVPRLTAQLVGLERRTAWGGRDSVDHGPGGHDDVANAGCGALVGASEAEARAPLELLFDEDEADGRQSVERAVRDAGVYWPGEGGA